MGHGDSIMATAQARAVSEAIGMKASFGEWVKLWKHNPFIAKEKGFPVKNMTGDRPYVLGQTDKKAIWNPNFRAIPGDIFLDKEEILDFGKDYILIQPEVKTLFSKGNKAWVHWHELVEKLEGENLIQMIPNKSEKEKVLKGVNPKVTDTFRIAVGALLNAKLIITTDGGLHHAAAARIYDPEGNLLQDGMDAVVIWTGFTHPRNLGYARHTNVRYDDSPPCGSKVPCDHCHHMAEKLTADMVYSAVREVLDG